MRIKKSELKNPAPFDSDFLEKYIYESIHSANENGYKQMLLKLHDTHLEYADKILNEDGYELKMVNPNLPHGDKIVLISWLNDQKEVKKFSFDMTFFDNPKNREKSEYMSPFDIMMDDIDNPLPQDWFETIAGDAGVDLPWGSKVKITVEIVK